MKHSYSATLNNVKIRPLERNDIELLRNWRNDKTQTKFLRPIPFITHEMQEKWYETYLSDSSIITFAIDEVKELNRTVGSLAIYDINGSTAEIGKIQIGDSEAHGKKIGRTAIELSTGIGSFSLGLKEITAFVHQHNFASYINFTKAGYVAVGTRSSCVGGVELKLVYARNDLKECDNFID